MATKSEINGWIQNAENSCRSYRKTIADCDRQIARLKPVYQKLGEIKADFRSIRKSTEGVFEEKGQWRGERHRSFCNAGEALDAICGDYYRQLDEAQDMVNRKIGELRAKKQELTPIIGSLMGSLEKWRVEIQNALN